MEIKKKKREDAHVPRSLDLFCLINLAFAKVWQKGGNFLLIITVIRL